MSAYFRLKSPQIPVPLLTPACISAILNIVCLKTDITNIFLVNEGLFFNGKTEKIYHKLFVFCNHHRRSLFGAAVRTDSAVPLCRGAFYRLYSEASDPFCL
mgnify:CR=1 FL=1